MEEIDDINIYNNNIVDSNIPYISSPIVNWNLVNVNLLNNTNINIDFKDIWRITKNIYLTTNEGHDVIYKFDDLNLFNNIKLFQFNLEDRIPNILKDFPNVNIKEVLIEELDGNFNSIYKL